MFIALVVTSGATKWTRYHLAKSSPLVWISRTSRFHPGIDHDDVIKWKHFPRYWPFVRGIHRSPVNSPHRGQWRGALMFSLICVWINGWVNNGEAGDCPACRTTLIATRFWVVMICPIIKCLTVLRVFFYFVWFVSIHHNFQFYFKLCTYCNILDINLS